MLTGQVICPRSPPDSLASFVDAIVPQEKWIVDGVCAYVPQVRVRLILLAVQVEEKSSDRRLGFVMRLLKVSMIHTDAARSNLTFPCIKRTFCSTCHSMKNVTRLH